MKYAGFIAGIATAAIAVTAASAYAESPKKGGHGPKASFEQMDANGDGQLTQAEMDSHRADRFAKMDKDGDGKLTAEEMESRGNEEAKERSAKMIKKFDKNGDGALTQDEMPKPRDADKMFGKMDADSSGGISKEEFETAREKMKEHGQKGHNKPKKDSTTQD